MTEEKAIRQLRRASQEALGWFIDKYTPYVSAIVFSIIGQSMTQADVEEVCADVFYALWNNASKVNEHSIKAWLGSVSRNLAKKKCREQGIALPLEEDIILVDEDSPEALLDKKERNRRVRLAVLSMEYPEREIFLRFYFYFQPLARISEEMGINLSTVKSKLHRGREKLKTVLNNEVLD